MATTTTVSGLPLPEGGDPNDIPGDVGAALTMIDKGWIQHLTAAEIAALPGPKMPAGLVVWNKTFLRHEVSDGTDWLILATRDYADTAVEDYVTSHVIADVVTGTTNANGELFVAVADSPTGYDRWVVTCNHEMRPGTQRFVTPIVSYSAGTTYVTFKVANAAGPLTSTPVTIHWQAVAY